MENQADIAWQEVTSTSKIRGSHRDFAKHSGMFCRLDWYLPLSRIRASQYERNVTQQGSRQATCLDLEVETVYGIFDRRRYV